MSKQKLIAIAGPTASGKTALAIALCKRIGGEVVSCDSMMVYKGMDIGTAKPTVAEMAGVPHHMLDVAEPGENYSAAQFRDAARAVIADISGRGAWPVLCGGTGLYIDAITRDMSFASAPSDAQLRARLEAELEDVGPVRMHARLAQVDPVTAARLHVNDTRRVIRALEIYETTGAPMSVSAARDGENSELYDFKLLALDMPRERLYARINRRVDQMCDQGLFEEVAGLLEGGLRADCTAMQALGYKEIAAALRGEVTREAALATLKQRTRNYAKRQLSWLRRDGRVIWLSVGERDTADTLCDRALELLGDWMN
ncbi:MAG TPA: tRNA (adenosine(37)-N6)-dimethylallyltransferase MiaA [Candidatus Fimadaptatus faecigallinarum]|uniref:tRNA dimethylallyltransferase n=1 Tax=Candidatus Fimadaptatus faecigallinarum TaxID=2840814 RepID=A0A9D1S5H4_9FIRM|nr:tRNA (adenosine(37)-N6)-dimethylallyltransferase MiaA [Candidatus Fimadaptatus faecigallinarum]